MDLPKPSFPTLLLGLLLLTVPALGEPLAVVVSVPPQGWLVEQVGGERWAVEVLLPAGQSPETYMPTDAEVTRVMRSVVFFVTGVPFERGPWFEAVRRSSGCRVIDLRRGIELERDDPHIWLSPRRLRTQAATIAAALVEVDPEHRELYTENHRRLDDRLRELDETIGFRLQPFRGRTFLVFHPSWSYFAADYGIVQLAIETEGREPSDREMTELLARARAVKVSTVFVSPQIRGRGARAVADGLIARVEMLDPLAEDVVTNLLACSEKLARSFAEEAADG